MLALDMAAEALMGRESDLVVDLVLDDGVLALDMAAEALMGRESDLVVALVLDDVVFEIIAAGRDAGRRQASRAPISA